MFFNIGVLKNFAIFTWKQLLNLFLIKLQAWGERCFSKKSAEFLRTTVLQYTSSGCFWNQWNILNLFIIVSVILSGYIYKLKFTRKVFKTDQVFKSFFFFKNLSQVFDRFLNTPLITHKTCRDWSLNSKLSNWCN